MLIKRGIVEIKVLKDGDRLLSGKEAKELFVDERLKDTSEKESDIKTDYKEVN